MDYSSNLTDFSLENTTEAEANETTTSYVEPTENSTFSGTMSVALETLSVTHMYDKYLLALALFSGISLIVFLLLLLIQILYYPRKKPSNLLKHLINEKCFPVEDEMILKRNGNALLKSDYAAEHFLNDNICDPNDKSENDKRLTMLVSTCRFPNIRCWRFNHVSLVDHPNVVLHVNKVEDFYGDPIYLCTAPISREIPMYLNLIDQEMIGVIVWLGKAEEFNKYIPLKLDEIERYGDYSIENMSVIEEPTYTVHICHLLQSSKNSSKLRFKQKVKVSLVLIHAHKFPAEDVPNNPSSLVELLEIVDLYQDRQTMLDPCLRGILIHYTSGTSCSPALCTMLICRQMLLKARKTNVLGVLRYVRRHRHSSFTAFPNGFKQFQLIYKVLGSVASRLPRQNGGGGKRTTNSVRHQSLYYRHKESLQKTDIRKRKVSKSPPESNTTSLDRQP